MKTIKDLKPENIITDPPVYIVDREADIDGKGAILFHLIENLDHDKCTYEHRLGKTVSIETTYTENDIKDMMKDNLKEFHCDEDKELIKKIFDIE